MISPQPSLTLACVLVFLKSGWNDVVDSETSRKLSGTEDYSKLHRQTSRSNDNVLGVVDVTTVISTSAQLTAHPLTSVTDRHHELLHNTPPVADLEHHNISVMTDDLVVSEANTRDCNPNYADQTVRELCKNAHIPFPDDSLIEPVYIKSLRNNCMKGSDWENKPTDDEDCFAGSGSGAGSDAEDVTQDDLISTSRETTWTYKSAEMPAGVTEEDRISASTNEFSTRSDEMEQAESETTMAEATRLYKTEQTTSSSDAIITNYETSSVDSSISDTTVTTKHTTEHPQVPPYPDYHPPLDAEDDSKTLVLVVSVSTGIVITIILVLFFTLKCRSRTTSRVHKAEENKHYSACSSQQGGHINQCSTPLPNTNDNIKNRNDKSKKRDIKECYV